VKWLIGLLVMVLAAGCSLGAPPGDPDDMELAAVELPRIDGTPDDARSGAAATNAFGLDVYRAIVASNPEAGVVVSPSSIALALAMARAGARGTTADEMDAVLRELGSDEHAAWIAALDAALGERTRELKDFNGDPQSVTLRIVNAPFGQRGFELERDYLEALAERFGAGLRLVDYIGATEAARAEINGWVADQTEERIEELLAQDTLDEQTRLVLVNAIYLKAAWLVPFEEDATRQEPFERLDGSTMDVPMMHLNASIQYAAGEGWQAVEIPYVGEQLGMVVIVPDDLTDFEAGFDAAAFETIVGALAPRQVALGLPRFGLETQVELGEVLADLGMPTAFTDDADFSGITTQQPLQISAVIHQANIDVDEKGTEAAAATAVVMRATGMPADPVTVTVDRPFVYALRDRVTGAILFLGRVTEPTERGS
jgi:serpin B